MKNINQVSLHNSSYLSPLAEISKPPKQLFYLGQLPEKRRPSVAIVGSRKLTHYGKDVGYRLAYELAQKGVVIVSGLAIGVDGIAHKAALDAGGTTIAIVAGGLPTIYPAAHRQLADQIVAGKGAIISEYPPGSPAQKHQFLERNRIVSGMSDVILIIEAASRSGTLATANFALEQGKELAVVPGNITSPMSAGCNQLIKTGAALITETNDILNLLGLAEADSIVQLPLAANEFEKGILELLASGVQDGHELQVQSHLEVELFQQTLSMLEITAKIRPLGGNQWTIR